LTLFKTTDVVNVNEKVSEFIAPREDPSVYPGKRLSYSYLTDGTNIYRIKFDDGDITRGIVYFEGKWRDLSDILKELKSENLVKRYPVLAYGSNASPGQLSYKFKNKASQVVLVLKGSLMDFDIIYGAKFIVGTIPAILVHSTKTNVECWINLLDEDQLQVMNESEQLGEDYSLGIFDSFQTDFGKVIKAYGYVGLMRGYKNEHGEFVALNEIKAINRKYLENSQVGIIQEIMNRSEIRRFTSRFGINDIQEFMVKLRDDIKFSDDINKILNQKYASSVEIRVPRVSSQNLSRFEEFI